MPAAAGGGCWRATGAGRGQVIGTLKAAFVPGMLAKEELDLRVAPPAATATLLLWGPFMSASQHGLQYPPGGVSIHVARSV